MRLEDENYTQHKSNRKLNLKRMWSFWKLNNIYSFQKDKRTFGKKKFNEWLKCINLENIFFTVFYIFYENYIKTFSKWTINKYFKNTY